MSQSIYKIKFWADSGPLTLQILHPIFDWEVTIHQQPPIFESTTPPTASAPIVTAKATFGAPFALEAPLKQKKAVPPISQLAALDLRSGFNLASIEIPDTPPQRPAAQNNTPIFIWDSPPVKGGSTTDSIMNLPLALPKTPPRITKKKDVIDLCSPDIIDLSTPPRLATKQEMNDLMSPFNMSPLRPSVKRKYNPPLPGKSEPDSIDIISPPRRRPKMESAAAGSVHTVLKREFTTTFGPIKVGIMPFKLSQVQYLICSPFIIGWECL
jgi:hypothetical protein